MDRVRYARGKGMRGASASHALSLARPGSEVSALRANIDETVLPVIITEQGENRNQFEEQRNIFGFFHGFACR